MTDETETDTFEFYLKFAKPLVLNLPDAYERVLAASWVKKLRDADSGTESVRKDYLKLLLFALNRKKLSGPFSENPANVPLKDLQKSNEILELAKDIILKEERDRQNRIKNGLAGGDYPPYSTECSADLLEYAAAQDIPKFGVHAYYALSFEPITKWDNIEKGVLPKGVVPEGQKPVANVSSAPIIGDKEETKTPRSTPKARKKLTPTLKTPKSTDDIEFGIPFGIVPPVDDRSRITWGSNLLEVNDNSDFSGDDLCSDDLNDAVQLPKSIDSPYLSPTRPGDYSYAEAPSLPYRTPDAYDSFGAAEAAFQSPKRTPKSPVRSPQGLDDSFAAAEAAFQSPKRTPTSPVRVPQAVSPGAMARAQYASLMSPEKPPPRLASPQSRAAAQYESLFDSPKRAKSPTLRSPGPREAEGDIQIATSRSPEARQIIEEVNESLLHASPTPEEGSPGAYDKYERYKRTDMPPTPPVFSKVQAIREGRGRELTYDPAQFGIAEDEAWQPGAGFSFHREPAGTTPTKPGRTKFEKRTKPVEVVFPRVARDDWSEMFFESQMPNLMEDEEDEDMQTDVSEMPADDLDARLNLLIGEMREKSKETPAAAGIAATSPRSTPTPTRINPYGTDFPIFEEEMPAFSSPEMSPCARADEQYASLMDTPPPPKPPCPVCPAEKTPSPAKDTSTDDFGMPHLEFERPKTPEHPPTPAADQSPRKSPGASQKTPPKTMTELQAIVDAQYAALYCSLVADESPTQAGPSGARSPQLSPHSPGDLMGVEGYTTHISPQYIFDEDIPQDAMLMSPMKTRKQVPVTEPKSPDRIQEQPRPHSPYYPVQMAADADMLFSEQAPDGFNICDSPPSPPSAPSPTEYNAYLEEFEPEESFDLEDDLTNLGPLLEAHEYDPYEPRTSITLQVGRRSKQFPISSRGTARHKMGKIAEEPEFTYLPPIEALSPNFASARSPYVRSPVAGPSTARSPRPCGKSPVAAKSPNKHVARDILTEAKEDFVTGFDNENQQNVLRRVIDIVEDVEDEENLIDADGAQDQFAGMPMGSPSHFLEAASPPHELSQLDDLEQSFGMTPPRRSPHTPPGPIDIQPFGFQGPVSDFMPEHTPYLLPFQREGYVRPEANVGTPPRRMRPETEMFPFLPEEGEMDISSPIHLIGDDDTELAEICQAGPRTPPRSPIRTPGRSPIRTPGRSPIVESPGLAQGLPVRPTRLTPESPPTPDLIDFIVSTAFRQEEPYNEDNVFVRQGTRSFMKLDRHSGKSAVPKLGALREVPETHDDNYLQFMDEVEQANVRYPWARQRQQPMPLMSGSRSMQLHRRSKKPGLQTVTEELDHVPTPTRLSPMQKGYHRPSRRGDRRGRRLDFDIENPDGSPEPPKLFNASLEMPLSPRPLPAAPCIQPPRRLPPASPTQVSPPSPRMVALRDRYPSPPKSPFRVHPPDDLLGHTHNVPHYNPETLLERDDDMPAGLQAPLRQDIGIAGWQTPPTLKTPEKTPKQYRFTDEFCNFMSYEVAPEEFLLLPDVPEGPIDEDDGLPLSTALPGFLEREQTPPAASPQRRFGRADSRTRVPRALSPTMKKTVRTVVECPSGSQSTTTTTMKTPSPPKSPATLAAARVTDAAAQQYAALLEDTPSPISIRSTSPTPPRYPTPPPPVVARRKTPSPATTRAAARVSNAAARQFAALFEDTPSPITIRSPTPPPPTRKTTTVTSETKSPGSPCPFISTSKTVEEVAAPITPRDYAVTPRPSPYWSERRTPPGTPEIRPRIHRKPQSAKRPTPPTIWDRIEAGEMAEAGPHLGEEIEPLDLMPIGSPASPHSTQSHMQQFVRDVRQSSSQMHRKPTVLYGHGEIKAKKLPRFNLGGHLPIPFEQPEPEDDSTYWPGPYDPKSVDLTKFAPRHLRYTQMENVESYEPPGYAPCNLPDPNLPFEERAEQWVGDVPEPEDLEFQQYSPHVPITLHSPGLPPAAMHGPQLDDSFEFPNLSPQLGSPPCRQMTPSLSRRSPGTPLGTPPWQIPADMRRQTPGTPVGSPPWQIPADMRRQTPGTPRGTPPGQIPFDLRRPSPGTPYGSPNASYGTPFRSDHFEGFGLEEGSPFSMYGSPGVSPQRSPISAHDISRSPIAGYSPGTAADIAALRLQADAQQNYFEPREDHRIIKRTKKQTLRRVPEVYEPPESPRRRSPICVREENLLNLSPQRSPPRIGADVAATQVYATADAQYAALYSPEHIAAAPPEVVDRYYEGEEDIHADIHLMDTGRTMNDILNLPAGLMDQQYALTSPPKMTEKITKYERFDPCTARHEIHEETEEVMDPGFAELAAAETDMFLLEESSPMVANLSGEDQFEDQFNIIAADDYDDVMMSPELYSSPQAVDPFIQSVADHEYPENFPDRRGNKYEQLVCGKRMMRMPRHAPAPEFADIMEMDENPVYGGRMGMPAIYPTGTPQSAVSHYSPELEHVRFDERAQFRPDLVGMEAAMYGQETPGTLEYYEDQQQPRSPLRRARLFEDYEDSPERQSPCAMSPQPGPMSPAAMAGAPPDRLSLSGFSEQFGFSPRSPPQEIIEESTEEIIFEDVPCDQARTPQRSPHGSPQFAQHVSPRMTQASPMQYPEFEDSFEYGDMEMFGGDLEPGIMDTSDIPLETDEVCDFQWID